MTPTFLRFAVLGIAFSLTGLIAQAAPKIGVLLKGKSPFWDAAEKGALEAGQKLGVEVVVKAPPTESDVALQIQLLNALVNQGCEALVVAPGHKEALVAPMKAAAAKGVKIVVIDSHVGGDQVWAFVGTNQKAAGEAAGKLLATLVTESDEVSIFRHNQSSEATIQRETGALEKFREVHPKSVVHSDIYAATEKNVEVERAETLWSKYPKTKAILASSTPGTMAMLKVLENKKLAGNVRFIGFGFNLNRKIAAALEDGSMDAWMAQQPGEVAAKGVQGALAALKGEDFPAVTYVDLAVITKANLKDPKIQAQMVD